jgi:hypothetical protein
MSQTPYLENEFIRIDFNPTAGMGIKKITVKNTPDGIDKFIQQSNPVSLRNAHELGCFGALIDNGSLQDTVGLWNPQQGFNANEDISGSVAPDWDNDGTTVRYRIVDMALWFSDAMDGEDTYWASDAATYIDIEVSLEGPLIHQKIHYVYNGPDRTYNNHTTNWIKGVYDTESWYNRATGPANGGPTHTALDYLGQSYYDNYQMLIGIGIMDGGQDEVLSYITPNHVYVGYWGNNPWAGENAEYVSNIFNKNAYPLGVDGIVPSDPEGEARLYPTENWIAQIDSVTGYGKASFSPHPATVFSAYGSFGFPNPSSGVGVVQHHTTGMVLDADFYLGFGHIDDLRDRFNYARQGIPFPESAPTPIQGPKGGRFKNGRFKV